MNIFALTPISRRQTQNVGSVVTSIFIMLTRLGKEIIQKISNLHQSPQNPQTSSSCKIEPNFIQKQPDHNKPFLKNQDMLRKIRSDEWSSCY